MKRTHYLAYFTLTALTATGLAFAQDNQNRGWRRLDDPAAAAAPDPQPDQNNNGPVEAPPPPAPQSPRVYSGQPAPPPAYNGPNYNSQAPAPAYNGPNYSSQAPPPPNGPNYNRYPSPYSQPSYGQNPQQQNQAPPPPPQPIPASLTLKPGTYITVRVNQVLSSDHNHAGDAFAATLVKPVIVDGVVVAERGQTIGGRVAEAKKAGMVEGTSRLGIQLTDLTLADGQNIPISSQLISRTASSSVDRDVAAVAGTTAIGAAAGAAADWGRGAAIGAGAGAAAGIIGVLLTRGHPTIIHPEQVLTFRVENSATFSTERAQQAFRWVEPGDYQQPTDFQRRGPAPTMRVGAPYPYPAPYFYGPAYYPYYGPSVGFYFGRPYYYRGWRR